MVHIKQDEQMQVTIRQEKPEDFRAIFKLVESAFAPLQMSDHKEQFLVERLRKSSAYVPELSIVAEIEGKIVGHILLTKVKIKNDQNEFDSLALAPVSVLPEYQGKGVGGMLIEQAHKKASEVGHKSVVLLGHKKYYPKFGYHQADKFGIKLPFEVPKEYCMAIELVKEGLVGVSGTVEYPKEFYE